MKGINTLVGDTARTTDLERWVQESGGQFDVILDDGGHKNHEIFGTLEVLYNKALLPGGYYFIEDLHVGRYVLLVLYNYMLILYVCILHTYTSTIHILYTYHTHTTQLLCTYALTI